MPIVAAALLLALCGPVFGSQQVHTPKLSQHQKDQIQRAGKNPKVSEQKLNKVKQTLHANNIHVTAKGALKKLPPKQRAQIQRDADHLNRALGRLKQQAKKAQGR
jgi:hypothetical protein